VFVRAAPLLLLTTVVGALSPDRPARAQPPMPGALPSSASMPAAQTPSPPIAISTNPFLGGVPTGAAVAEPLKLTILDAITRALDHNLGVLTAEESLGRARGARGIALSQLLPNVSGRIGETRQKINLAAFGFGGPGGPSFPGVSDIVGPFNVFDARLYVSQAIFDREALNDARAEAHQLEAARLMRQSARDFVIHVAGNLYIQALAASARVATTRAQLETATALHQQALDLRQNGLVAGIDVLRAQVQQSVQQQRATAAVNDFEKLKLGIARAIGLPLGQTFTLDAALPELPPVSLSVDEAVQRAYQSRPDYQAALSRVRAAESARAAVAGSLLPSVHVNADVGEIGFTPRDAKATFAVIGSVNVPIFNGGRTQGRLAQADAEIRARRADAEDLKASIYYEVKGAFLDLETTADQLRTATTARDLAAQQLVQARDRFAAGVASNVEVIQAQEAVALAGEQFIAAQYGFSLASGALVRGVGSSEETLRQLIGGRR
jgi:outer membrane protein TolC